VADPIQFFFDQHLSPRIVVALRQRGIDVLTAQETGRCGLPDSDQLQFATVEERVIVTFDQDYLVLDASGVKHTGIVWCGATKYSIGQLIQALVLVHGVLSRDEMRNHVEYL
jgi:predicted nuclease of predicted toxin-antitoxin system